jgi:caffeoyl-CoA O-methyltransferase
MFCYPHDSKIIIMKKSIIISASFLVAALILAGMTYEQTRTGGRTVSSIEVFDGINDERVLPMLRNLPRTHGGMNVPAADGRFLYDLILEKGYTRGLEIGTSNGYSGLWIGLALRQNGGSLVTVEINPRAADEAKANFRKAGLDGLIEVITSDALKAIPEIPGTFDFVFIDAHKPQYYDYLQLVRHRVSEGGAITAHNVTGRDRSMANFEEAIRNDPGLETEVFSRHTMSVSIVKDSK